MHTVKVRVRVRARVRVRVRVRVATQGREARLAATPLGTSRPVSEYGESLLSDALSSPCRCSK